MLNLIGRLRIRASAEGVSERGQVLPDQGERSRRLSEEEPQAAAASQQPRRRPVAPEWNQPVDAANWITDPCTNVVFFLSAFSAQQICLWAYYYL